MKNQITSFKVLLISPLLLIMASCGAPNNQGLSLSESLANIPREQETKYENEYKNMVKMGAKDGMICAHISVAIITPVKEGWTQEVRKWGKRQIDLDCWGRTYKTYSDLPR